VAAWVPLIVLIVAIGFFPRIVFESTTDAVVSLVQGAFGSEGTTAAIGLGG
jgi:hypothetical protein